MGVHSFPFQLMGWSQLSFKLVRGSPHILATLVNWTAGWVRQRGGEILPKRFGDSLLSLRLKGIDHIFSIVFVFLFFWGEGMCIFFYFWRILSVNLNGFVPFKAANDLRRFPACYLGNQRGFTQMEITFSTPQNGSLKDPNEVTTWHMKHRHYLHWSLSLIIIIIIDHHHWSLIIIDHWSSLIIDHHHHHHHHPICLTVSAAIHRIL